MIVRPIFLDASTDALVRRFSETRRPHPPSQGADLGRQHRRRAPRLIDAIDLERELLADLRAVSSVIDTSQLRPAQLRLWLRDLVQVPSQNLTLGVRILRLQARRSARCRPGLRRAGAAQSVRMNRSLSALNGRDAGVIDFLEADSDVMEMLEQIGAFVARWLPNYAADHRSYLTVAIGCTGGQHRSVYMVETLAQRFAGRAAALVRHRELHERRAD